LGRGLAPQLVLLPVETRQMARCSAAEQAQLVVR